MTIPDSAVEAAARAVCAIRCQADGCECTVQGPYSFGKCGCEDIARAALTAGLAAMWQPIETAPRDGTTIDLWFAGTWNRRMPDFAWRSYWASDLWRVAYNEDPAIITHWQPLPPAPAK